MNDQSKSKEPLSSDDVEKEMFPRGVQDVTGVDNAAIHRIMRSEETVPIRAEDIEALRERFKATKGTSVEVLPPDPLDLVVARLRDVEKALLSVHRSIMMNSLSLVGLAIVNTLAIWVMSR